MDRKAGSRSKKVMIIESGKIQNSFEEYEGKKRAFFARFALNHLSAFKLHKEFGLLPKTEGWSNVSKHCLMEAVAMEVLAEELNLSEEESDNLVQAALLHDFYKRREIELMKKQGTSAESLVIAEGESENILTKRGIKKDVVLITDATGLTKIDRMKQKTTTLLEKIMFYVDNITAGDEIVNLKERIESLPQRYPDIAKTGIYPILLKCAEGIERELSERLQLNDPETLPDYIKAKIHEKIESSEK